jgi:hypothetical protein
MLPLDTCGIGEEEAKLFGITRSPCPDVAQRSAWHLRSVRCDYDIQMAEREIGKDLAK